MFCLNYYIHSNNQTSGYLMAAPDVSTNRNDDFELLDSVYSSATSGEIEVFKEHKKEINQILTPKW